MAAWTPGHYLGRNKASPASCIVAKRQGRPTAVAVHQNLQCV